MLCYQPTTLEILINNILIERGITDRFDLTITKLSDAFGFEIIYLPVESTIAYSSKTKKTRIILNNQLNGRELYEQLYHELAHYILDHITEFTKDEKLIDYYEMKANYAMQYIAMPYFAIDTIINLGDISRLTNYFYVTPKLAAKRLDNIKNRTLEEVQRYSNNSRTTTGGGKDIIHSILQGLERETEHEIIYFEKWQPVRYKRSSNAGQ